MQSARRNGCRRVWRGDSLRQLPAPVVRQLRYPRQLFPGEGVGHGQAPRMERDHAITGWGRRLNEWTEGARAAIGRITQHRMTAPRGLDAQLMHPACEGRQFDERGALPALENAIPEHRELRARLALRGPLDPRLFGEFSHP